MSHERVVVWRDSRGKWNTVRLSQEDQRPHPLSVEVLEDADCVFILESNGARRVIKPSQMDDSVAIKRLEAAVHELNAAKRRVGNAELHLQRAIYGELPADREEAWVMGSVTGRWPPNGSIVRQLVEENPIRPIHDAVQISYADLEKRVFAQYLAASGLVEWFRGLQTIIDTLRPNGDLLAFRREIEEHLDDEVVKSFREQAARAGDDSPSETG